MNFDVAEFGYRPHQFKYKSRKKHTFSIISVDNSESKKTYIALMVVYKVVEDGAKNVIKYLILTRKTDSLKIPSPPRGNIIQDHTLSFVYFGLDL